ncbi:MAG: flagellar biosynthesis anti-sigma factor FlgM [Eubacteriales bacterium]
MKIDKIVNKYLDNSTRKQRDDTDKKTSTVKGNDKVEISSSAKSLVKKISQSENTMYSEKVEKIRQSVQQGCYKVSPEEIADKIIQEITLQKDSGKIL